MNNDVLKNLRRLNPALPLFSVEDRQFAQYGQILEMEGRTELFRALEALPVPADGNRYSASDAALEALPVVDAVGQRAFGKREIQAGFCNGSGHMLNALEYHKCSEVNYTSTGLVLLLALPSDIINGKIDSSAVVGFYLPPDTVVEIYPEVLHFAPCRVRPEGFNCLVVLERGVNTPLEAAHNGGEGEDAMLWMTGKWLLCHPDSPQAEKGAYVGIDGENIDLKIG